MFVPMILMFIFALYGLSWLIFAFVNPPYFLMNFYQTPSLFYFLGDRTVKVLMAVITGGVVPLLIKMFWLG